MLRASKSPDTLTGRLPPIPPRAYDGVMPHAVSVTGVRKCYRQGERTIDALRGIDLQIEEGEFVAIMGASGSGKSTLLHLCAALDRADEGTIEIAGQRLEKMNESQLTLFRRRR